MSVQGATAHFNVVARRKSLESDRVHVDGGAAAELERAAQSVCGACVADDIVFIAPFLSQNLGKGMIVANSGNAVVSIFGERRFA